ncbi:hypothetical protein V8G54_005414 [Vigna mungo]|uniref:Tf2-1-like SH3-like domain-containing protein n=1 Tax=Vigna mungo TaxID=3915 RepID=A0AAQ3S5H6_VIGMU
MLKTFHTEYNIKLLEGFLHLLPITTGVWEDISLDFVTGLPPSNGYIVLLVVVDCFSKVVCLGVLHSGLTTYKVVELFVTLVCKHYRLSKSTSSNAGYDFVLTSREEILSCLKDNLLKAQTRIKKLADSKSIDLNFEVRSWVYLKLQSYRQVSVSGHKYHKLVKHFHGPYKVLKRIGPVTYEIELSLQSKIHNIFHYSMLKRHEGFVPPSIDHLPLEFVENNPLSLLIVDGVPTRFALVQWNRLSPSDTSWEKWQGLKSLYDLEDKVLVEGDGIVTKGQGPLNDGARPKRLVEASSGVISGGDGDSQSVVVAYGGQFCSGDWTAMLLAGENGEDWWSRHSKGSRWVVARERRSNRDGLRFPCLPQRRASRFRFWVLFSGNDWQVWSDAKVMEVQQTGEDASVVARDALERTIVVEDGGDDAGWCGC